MLSALTDGHSICYLCCKARPTDPEYWEKPTDALKDWKFRIPVKASEIVNEDFDAQVAGYIDNWCGGNSHTSDSDLGEEERTLYSPSGSVALFGRAIRNVQ